MRSARRPARRGERGLPRDDERGFVLVWFAVVLVLLLAAAALAVDIVFALREAERAQKAADAAALGGAVYLPDDPGSAQTTAQGLSAENGFANGAEGVSVQAGVGDRPTQLEVEVRTPVDTFFAGIIGIDEIDVARRAVAEYDQPVAMGSPANTFGNQPDCSAPCTTGDADPDFWANIAGPSTNKRNGDAYASGLCSGADVCAGSANGEYRGEYVYLVRNRAAGAQLLIEAFDLVHVDVGGQCGDAELGQVYALTGEPRYEPGPNREWCTGDSTLGDSNEATDVHVSVLAPDDTPWDHSDNPPVSSPSCQPFTLPGEDGAVDGVTNATDWFRRWNTVCDISGAEVGDYVLRLRTEDAPSSQGGNNKFSLRANVNGQSASSQVSVFAEERMSLFANADNTDATFHLARVFPGAAGRTLALDFFDIGDVGSTGTLRIIPPSDSNYGDFAGCTYTPPPGFSSAPDPDTGLWGPSPPDDTEAGCRVSGVQAGSYGSGYQGNWISWRIPIPDDYTCDFEDPFGCWVLINFSFGADVHDTTTWTARLEGNPVRLVE